MHVHVNRHRRKFVIFDDLESTSIANPIVARVHLPYTTRLMSRLVSRPTSHTDKEALNSARVLVSQERTEIQ